MSLRCAAEPDTSAAALMYIWTDVPDEHVSLCWTPGHLNTPSPCQQTTHTGLTSSQHIRQRIWLSLP